MFILQEMTISVGIIGKMGSMASEEQIQLNWTKPEIMFYNCDHFFALQDGFVNFQTVSGLHFSKFEE